jgi:hypothetical protein
LSQTGEGARQPLASLPVFHATMLVAPSVQGYDRIARCRKEISQARKHRGASSRLHPSRWVFASQSRTGSGKEAKRLARRDEIVDALSPLLRRIGLEASHLVSLPSALKKRPEELRSAGECGKPSVKAWSSDHHRRLAGRSRLVG